MGFAAGVHEHRADARPHLPTRSKGKTDLAVELGIVDADVRRQLQLRNRFGKGHVIGVRALGRADTIAACAEGDHRKSWGLDIGYPVADEAHFSGAWIPLHPRLHSRRKPVGSGETPARPWKAYVH